jgi:hypothetical protein
VGLPCVIVATICQHYFPGWGRTVLTTIALVGLLAAIWRRLWVYWWFWAVFSLLTIAHCISIVSFRNLLNGLNIAAWFVLVIVEALVFAVVISIPISLMRKRHPEII